MAALALVAMFVAGCSDAPKNGGGDKNAVDRSQGVKFAKCMREHGVAEFPDPDASGELTIDGIANRSSLDTESAAFKQALSACKDLQPAGFTGRKRSTGQQAAALEFAQCMRDNGIEDFPDPTPDAPIIDTTRIPSAAGRGALEIPGFQDAMESCRDASEKALAGQR